MNAVGFVQGLKYEAKSYAVGLGAGGKNWHIFIRSDQLDVREDGSVCEAELPSFTFAAYLAEKEALRKIGSGEYPNWDVIIKREMEKADETALTPIQIPQELVNRIKALYKRSTDANTPKEEVAGLRQEIQTLVMESKIFNK